MIKIASFSFNAFGENTYVLSGDDSSCIIVDAGCYSVAERTRLAAYIAQNSLRPILALNTHAHIDHVCGVDFVKGEYGIPFALHPLDTQVLQAVSSYGEALGFHIDSTPVVDKELSDAQSITLGADTLRIIHTPGHTAGGVCIYIESQKMLLTGDTLFAGSIGRTDLPTGSYDDLMRSIVERILPLGADVTIFAGHGPSSDLRSEVQRNPFITDVLSGDMPYAN